MNKLYLSLLSFFIVVFLLVKVPQSLAQSCPSTCSMSQCTGSWDNDLGSGIFGGNGCKKQSTCSLVECIDSSIIVRVFHDKDNSNTYTTGDTLLTTSSITVNTTGADSRLSYPRTCTNGSGECRYDSTTGRYSFWTLKDGSHTVTITIPSGYVTKSGYANPRTVSLSGSQLEVPFPLVTPTVPTNTPLPPTPTVLPTNTPRPPTATPRPPTNTPAVPTSTPTITNYSIQGRVFEDNNNSKIYDSGDTLPPNNISLTTSRGTITYDQTNKTYQINNISAGIVSISYSPTSGYSMVYPKGTPPTFSPTVGTSCTVDQTTGASCNTQGNIVNLNFAISKSFPWIQVSGLDARLDTGMSNPIPADASLTCKGAYFSVPASASSPGIVIGNGAFDFGSGSVSTKNWFIDTDTYLHPAGKRIYSSYTSLLSETTKSGITTTSLVGKSYCTQQGSTLNCTLPSTLPSGIYHAPMDVNLQAFTPAANRSYIFLANGTLRLQGEVHLASGAFALFSANRDIIVNRSIGDTTPSCPPSSHIEGFFTAGRNFIVDGITNCTAGTDSMLGIQGAVVTNAILTDFYNGKFDNRRDLCSNNTYPAVTVSERPDLLLRLPRFLKQRNYLFTEVAP